MKIFVQDCGFLKILLKYYNLLCVNPNYSAFGLFPHFALEVVCITKGVLTWLVHSSIASLLVSTHKERSPWGHLYCHKSSILINCYVNCKDHAESNEVWIPEKTKGIFNCFCIMNNDLVEKQASLWGINVPDISLDCL